MRSDGPIMLVGGSGLGPWAWERVAPSLRRQGFQVMTPQLRSTGEDSTPPGTVDLDDWVEDVASALSGHTEVTLLAHSFAGYVAAAVMERDPSSLRQVVLLDAVIPQPNRSWFDAMGPEVAGFMTSLARDGAIPWFSREQLDQLYPGHGITDADYAWMQAHLTGQPIGTCTQAAITRPMKAGSTRVAYIRCLRTNPPAADPSAIQPDWAYRTLDDGHWPMITDPAACAEATLELGDS